MVRCDKAIMRSEYDDAWRHRHCTVADTAIDNFEWGKNKQFAYFFP